MRISVRHVPTCPAEPLPPASQQPHLAGRVPRFRGARQVSSALSTTAPLAASLRVSRQAAVDLPRKWSSRRAARNMGKQDLGKSSRAR